jgi:hypothetical protein
VDDAGSGRELVSQFVAWLSRHRDRIDLDGGYDSMLPNQAV